MSKRLLTTPTDRDPGSEGGRGYDYQWHVGARLAIQMLHDKETEYIVCEFHEDTVTINSSLELKLVQIKKRETNPWTMSDLIKPEKKQKQGIFCKLFSHLAKGKDIKSLLLTGYGRLSNKDEISLLHLISLLSHPLTARDSQWNLEMQKYLDHFYTEIIPQGIDQATILKAIQILTIDFSLPHPDVIEQHNCHLMDVFIRQHFQADLSMPEITSIYDSLYKRIRQVSLKPGQPWALKSVSRQEAMNIVYEKLIEYKPLKNRQQILTIHDKLFSVGMSDKYYYVVERRLEAMRTRIELGITSSEWETFKTTIDQQWREFRSEHPDMDGPPLWQSLREVLSKIASSWLRINGRFNDDFAEGIFFDMTGTCEVKWSKRI